MPTKSQRSDSALLPAAEVGRRHVPSVERLRSIWNVGCVLALCAASTSVGAQEHTPSTEHAGAKEKAGTWVRPVLVLHGKKDVRERLFIEGEMADHFQQYGAEADVYLESERAKQAQELALANDLLKRGEQAFVQVEANDAQMGLELGAELLTQHLDQGARLQDAARAHALLGALFLQEGHQEAAEAAFADALSLLPTLAPPDFFGDEEKALFGEVSERLAFSETGMLVIENGPFEVWVDGRFVGVSPLRQPVAPGLHAVTLRRLHEMRQTQLVRVASNANVRVMGPNVRPNVEAVHPDVLASMQLTLDDPTVDEQLMLRGIDPSNGVWVFRTFRYAEQVVLEAALFDASGTVRRGRATAERAGELKDAMNALRTKMSEPSLAKPAATAPTEEEGEMLPPAVLWGAVGASVGVAVMGVVVVGVSVLLSSSNGGDTDADRRAAASRAARQTVLGY